MKLNNSALQELYETIVNCTITFSPYADSPVDKVFKKCDEKLSESITFECLTHLQNRNDILEKSNGTLLSANLDLATKKGQLEKEVEDLKKAKMHLEQSRLGWVDRANKSVEEFNLANKEITELKNRLDKANADRTERENEAIRELVDVRSQLNYCTHSRDNWRARAKHAEKEVEDLKKDNEWLKRSRIELAKKVAERDRQIKELKATFEKANADRAELQKDRDSYCGLYTELRKDYDKLFEDNRKLKARTDCHRYEVEWYRKHYKEKSEKIRELKSRLNSLYGVNCYDQGQTDLWVKLQNVNDSQPFELATCFPDVTGMEDILSWNLEDFLDAYKKWREEKEKERLDHMRDYLARFCEGRLCSGCPLGSDEYKCGKGYSFRKFADDDQKIIPDEELERHYEKVKTDDPCSGVREKIKEACDAFYDGIKAGLASEVKEVPVSCDIPIKDLTSWECTIEATVEVNKDLLEKVCGVKLDDK